MNLPWWAWALIAWTLIQFPLGVLIGRLLERHEDSEDPKPPAGGGGLSPGAAETATPLPGGAVSPAGPTPPPAARHASLPGAATTARVLRFQADLECGCEITHHLPRLGANSMRTEPCAGHGWCALCGWRIGGVGDGRYAYVWETCPAHSQPAVTP